MKIGEGAVAGALLVLGRSCPLERLVSHLVDTYPRLTPRSAHRLVWEVSEAEGTEVVYLFDPAVAGGALIELRLDKKRRPAP